MQTKETKLINWCYSELNDSYAPIDNLLVMMDKHLGHNEYIRIMETLYDKMVESGDYDESKVDEYGEMCLYDDEDDE